MLTNSANTPIQTSHAYRQLFSGKNLNASSKQEVVQFLKSSHARYEKVTIPQIEQNFLGLMKILPDEPSISVIFNLFVKFQISFELHMKIEEQTIYPAALAGEATIQTDSEETHSHEEPFLTEIIHCLKRQSYAFNPFCQTLINRLDRFNEELKNHAWIEEHLI